MDGFALGGVNVGHQGLEDGRLIHLDDGFHRYGGGRGCLALVTLGNASEILRMAMGNKFTGNFGRIHTVEIVFLGRYLIPPDYSQSQTVNAPLSR
jgi:hypothetical protein